MDETRRNMDKIPATAVLPSMSRTVESGYATLNLICASLMAAHLRGAMIRRRKNHGTDAPDARQRTARSTQLG
jgi:hypothetical protein